MEREFFRQSTEFVCCLEPGWMCVTREGRADCSESVFFAGVFVGVEEFGDF